MTGRSYVEGFILAIGLVAAIGSGGYAWRIGGPYGERFDVDPRVEREYDSASGRARLIAFDSDGDLRLDTWSYLDGDRLVRMEFDDDGNGTRDRRQYFKADGTVERTESLRRAPATATPGAERAVANGQ